jgi:hypothetical protein
VFVNSDRRITGVLLASRSATSDSTSQHHWPPSSRLLDSRNVAILSRGGRLIRVILVVAVVAIPDRYREGECVSAVVQSPVVFCLAMCQIGKSMALPAMVTVPPCDDYFNRHDCL